MKRLQLRSLGFSMGLAISAVAHAGGLQSGWKSFRDPTIQDYGYEWSKVGHAGNADWVGTNQSFQQVRTGGVDYRYRIAKSEVTTQQWYEFVQAYAPFAGASANHIVFRGRNIGLNGSGGYTIAQGTENWGTEVGWRFAARYVNWLHNNKVNEAWAFESGVYDTSTFGEVPGELQITDQHERSEGARYFLPTNDEWNKAVHFDPNRYGEGQEGYWHWTNTSNTAPVAGAPGTPGAETNAGTNINVDILSYPNTQTPWGLYDASGSVYEWLETLTPFGDGRLAGSTDEDSHPIGRLDRINEWYGGLPHDLYGIRLASIIPAPGASLAALPLGIGLYRRRRQAWSSCSHISRLRQR